MGQEQRRAALRAMTQPVQDDRERSRLLYKALAGDSSRLRKNASLARSGQPIPFQDLHLVALDGGTTITKGDGVGTNFNAQLPRPPRAGQQGGRTNRHVVTHEMELHDFMAVVESRTDEETYECVIANRVPPETTDSRTGKAIIADQTDVIDNLTETVVGDTVTVRVYGNNLASFSYDTGHVIEVKQEIQWECITVYVRQGVDRAAKAVTTRVQKEVKWYNTIYTQGGGGE